MTFKKNFGGEILKFRWWILKIYFTFPLKVTTRAVKIWKFLSKMSFFKPVPNFRVLSLLLSNYFSNFCTTFFLRFFFTIFFSQFFFHNFFLNFLIFKKFSIFKIFQKKFSKFFLYIFVIFKKLGFIWCRATHPFGTLAMESAKKGFAKSKMDNTMYCKCPKVILTLTVLFRN